MLGCSAAAGRVRRRAAGSRPASSRREGGGGGLGRGRGKGRERAGPAKKAFSFYKKQIFYFFLDSKLN